MQLIPSSPDVRQCVYISFSGVSFNKLDTSFDITPSQYVSFYKKDRALSKIPIRAHFNEVRYKTKIPLPANGSNVSVEGFLTQVELDSDGQPSLLHVQIDNINFLGRAVIAPVTPSSSQGMNWAISLIFVS
jgi:hypothetical protein